MQIIKSSISFGATKGSGPQTSTQDVSFSGPVTKASAVLTGFVAEFPREDHHFGKLDIFLDTTLLGGKVVRVTARFGLRDWSGNWDDDYDGRVDFAVIAE